MKRSELYKEVRGKKLKLCAGKGGCGKFLPFDRFDIEKGKYLRSSCRECRKKQCDYRKWSKHGIVMTARMRKTYKIEDGVVLRLCSGKNGCGEWKPLKENYYLSNQGKWQVPCKSCRNKKKNHVTHEPIDKPPQANYYKDGSWWKEGRFGLTYRWDGFFREWLRGDYESYGGGA